MKKIKTGCLRAVACIKQKKALAPLLAALLAFNLCILASVAWFAVNRKGDANNMGFALAIDDTTAIYRAYMYDLKELKGTDVGEDGEMLNITNIDLNQYDTIFRAQNRYTPAFAKIQIVRNNSMPENGTILITVEKNPSTATNGTLDLLSSSVIRFTAMIDPTKEDLKKTTPEDLYDYINTPEWFAEVEDYAGNERANSKTFVTLTGEGDTVLYNVNVLNSYLNYVAGLEKL